MLSRCIGGCTYYVDYTKNHREILLDHTFNSVSSKFFLMFTSGFSFLESTLICGTIYRVRTSQNPAVMTAASSQSLC